MLRLDQSVGEPRQSFRFPQSAIHNLIAQRAINIVAAQPRVAVSGEHFENSVIQFDNRNVEGAAAEIVDGDLRAALQFVETVGESGRRRFVDDSFDGEPRQFSRALRRAALCVIKICGHGDHGARDRVTQRSFRIALQLLKNQRGNLLGRMRLIVRYDPHRLSAPSLESVGNIRIAFAQLIAAQTDEALDRINCVGRLHGAHTRGRLPYERRTFTLKTNDRWRKPRPIRVRDENRKSRLHYANERVGGAEIDTDNFVHSCAMRDPGRVMRDSLYPVSRNPYPASRFQSLYGSTMSRPAIATPSGVSVCKIRIVPACAARTSGSRR